MRLTVWSQWGLLVVRLAACWLICHSPIGATCYTRCCLCELKRIADAKESVHFSARLSCRSDSRPLKKMKYYYYCCRIRVILDIGTSFSSKREVVNFSASWSEWIFFLFVVLQLSCAPPSLRIFNSTSGPMLESLGDGGCADNPKHYSFMAVMSLIATTMLVQVSHLIKLGLMVLVVTATGAVNIYSWRDLYDLYDYMQFASYRWEMTNHR